MEIKQVWEDCSICFKCPVCGAELIADSRNGPEKCGCGTEYYLSARVVIIPLAPKWTAGPDRPDLDYPPGGMG